MKLLVGALLLFAALFSIGFSSARSSLDKPESVEAAIFGKAKFAKFDEDYVLVYPDSNGNPKLVYDLDTLTVFPVGQPNPIKVMISKIGGWEYKFDPKTPIAIIEIVNPVVVSTVGSVALGISAKDLLSNPTMRSALRQSLVDRRILIGIASAITGYSLGQFIAHRFYVPELNSPEVLKLINDKTRWYRNHLQLFVNAVINAEADLHGISDEKIRKEAISALNESIKHVAARMNGESEKKSLPHLTSNDVKYLIDRLQPYQTHVAQSLKSSTNWASIFASLLWLPLIAVSIGALCVAAMLIRESVLSRRQQAFPKIQDDI